MKLPYGDFGIVVPRSSTCLKHGIMMANSIGIIDNEFCGDGDVWGFVAYAIRDAVIEQGTRIAQFMPWPLVPDWDAIMFEEVASMGCADRGGYGSTGEMSAGAPAFIDANGKELNVGDFVTDEFGVDYCVMGLHEGCAGVTFADLGNSETSPDVAPCKSLVLDERPHDCDGVPIEVGDVVWVVYEDGSSVYDCSVVVVNTDGANGLVRVRQKQENGWSNFYFPSKLTHREPDSFELLAREMGMDAYDYCEEYGIACGGDDDPAEFSMRADLVRRMKAVAARG